MYQTCTLPFPVTSDRDIPDKSTDPREKYLRNVLLFWQVSARSDRDIPSARDRDIPNKSTEPKEKYPRNVSLFWQDSARSDRDIPDKADDP